MSSNFDSKEIIEKLFKKCENKAILIKQLIKMNWNKWCEEFFTGDLAFFLKALLKRIII